MLNMAKGAAFVSLDPYKLTGIDVTGRKLGSGSAAVVMELQYMGHKCAGKKIHDILLKSGGSDYLNATRRFSKECHFLSRIQHPNIVQFLGVYYQDPEESLPFLVMEFLPIDLTKCVKHHRVLPSPVSSSVLHDIARGLLFLHDQKPKPIIHRDLSSNNILLTPILTAKIADLGVARIVNLSPLQVSALTRAPGTPTYMPPEVMVDDPHYNTSIDTFSYGILMIQLFCGRLPSPKVAPTRKGSDGMLVAVSEAERRQSYLTEVGQDHPLMNLILKCIDNDPKQRPSAREIVEDLEEKAKIGTLTFQKRVEIMNFVAEEEAKKRKKQEEKDAKYLLELKEEKEKLKKLAEDQKSKICRPNLSTWMIALLFALVALFLGYVYTPQCAVPLPRGLEQAQSFINSTITECAVQETLNCDELVPRVIHDLVGNISWKSGADLPTTLHQGQSVVIGEKMYYGGGFADNEVHKYNVYSYHLRLDKWTVSGLPVKSFGLGEFDGQLLAVGGITMEGEESKKVYTYDESANSWSSVLPDMPISRTFPAVLSLSSTLIIAGGGENSIGIYSSETGWYWSNQPLPVPCTDVTLAVAGRYCYALAGNYSKELLQKDWFPLSQYVSTEYLLYDRNKVTKGTAFECRNELMYPSYQWRDLEGGFSAQANSLIGTVFASNLVTVGIRSQSWNNSVRMYSLTQKSWVQIGQLPEGIQAGSATITSLPSFENFLVTGKRKDGLLSVFIGSLELFHTNSSSQYT